MAEPPSQPSQDETMMSGSQDLSAMHEASLPLMQLSIPNPQTLTLGLPQIAVHPATPIATQPSQLHPDHIQSQLPQHQMYTEASLVFPQPPLGSQSSASLQGLVFDTPSQNGDLLSGLSLKHKKVTMGPRADCEKCRLGVRGHWLHLNE